jgi:hypothetical protein
MGWQVYPAVEGNRLRRHILQQEHGVIFVVGALPLDLVHV